MASRSSAGFTLIELMIVVVVLGILAAVAIPNYVSARARSYDASMKSDLHTSFMQIENYKIINGELPPSEAALQASVGLQLSPGVTFDKFEREMEDGVMSIHMHVMHPQSPNKFHAHYPAEGSNIEVRN